MFGYRNANGDIIAINPNDMSGCSGWERVPDNTVPVVQEEQEQQQANNATLETRVKIVETTTGEIVDILADALGVTLE